MKTLRTGKFLQAGSREVMTRGPGRYLQQREEKACSILAPANFSRGLVSMFRFLQKDDDCCITSP